MNQPSPELHGDACDIAIVGGGPVGLALACRLLQTSPWRIALIDAATPARAARDPRAIALSHGSRDLLAQLDAWPVAATPIEHIHVSQRGRFGHVKLHHDDYGIPALGYVVRYGDLCAALEHALGRAGGQQRLVRAFDTRIDAIDQIDRTDRMDGGFPPEARHGPAGAAAEAVAAGSPDTAPVQLRGAGPDGQPVRLGASLAVQAEGGLFHQQVARTAAAGATGTRRRDYGQTAIVSHVACSHPLPGWAWERFTEQGPLALLPHDLDDDPHGDGGSGYALVWCCSPEEAARRLALDDARFLAELGEVFGPRMGRFTRVGKRHAFPLGLNAAELTVKGRLVAIGNAAQTLHPVAGQGLNLGLRDAFALADELRTACTPQALAAFGARHRLDRAVTIGVTDLLPRVFGIPYPLAAHARGASLAALACLSPLKHALAHQMIYGMRR
ncbi:UbiH/UbiF/VisC/COQ6 family ubiquinone biosynthesis hydroxylase [Cupriavidus cauae]|uniref:UbiH/UbiF/VisC/COQ6 family ubiquinone biosynthesis hydroxylase n=1 Tax=Cupriavidus cauae TaxID=2608999 RepID=A0A5M8AP24_9BURK|nr:UbiH/UbiF/VisC/COQ6 family ubiquinone biosynthesis hydroxylase [Cupriavidus cauae]KAA6123786.1 UbiH/UbiF/VisC/COQ6 family ubiquinone biosynthesis hydroxylase [Cupriavidus cauae]